MDQKLVVQFIVEGRNHKDQSRKDLQLPEFDNNSNKVGWGHSASDAWKYTIKHDYNAGEFVWTGFDYIGEPTPWNGTGPGSVSGGNPAPKSSYFGIVDTAGFEKDVYYLYQSQWNDDVNTLHVLPTWNEEDIPVQNGNVQVDVFTDAYKVELYLNGRLIDTKISTEHITDAGYKYYTFENDSLYPSFTVPYEAGTIEAKGYDKEGNLLTNTEGRSSVTTYGEVSTVDLSADKTTISADGYDLSYITVDIVDADGNIVSVENVSTFTYSGNIPTLPKTVKGYLANGIESEEFVVNWNLDGLDFSTENTNVSVPGTVELLGETYNVIANVRVVPALKAAKNLAINKSSENDDVPTLSQSCKVTADNLNSINNGITNGGELYPSFTVPYEAGTIEAKGYDKEGNLLTNTEGRSSVTTYGEVSTVDLSADKTTINADGYDLSYITVDLVDADGNIASGANNKLTYTLEGNGKIVGLDNGNAADTDRYKPATDIR